MDIESLYTLGDHEDGAEMQVINPVTGEETQAFITLKGMDSLAHREAMSLSKTLSLGLKQKSKEALEKRKIEIRSEALAKCTVSWRGFSSKGEELVFSQEKAKELYYNSQGIADQVDNFMVQRANFTKG